MDACSGRFRKVSGRFSGSGFGVKQRKQIVLEYFVIAFGGALWRVQWCQQEFRNPISQRMLENSGLRPRASGCGRCITWLFQKGEKTIISNVSRNEVPPKAPPQPPARGPRSPGSCQDNLRKVSGRFPEVNHRSNVSGALQRGVPGVAGVPGARGGRRGTGRPAFPASRGPRPASKQPTKQAPNNSNDNCAVALTLQFRKVPEAFRKVFRK